MLSSVILRQLIQTGRRFCECRPDDFIPKSDDRIVIIAYSINDRFLACSFDAQAPETLDEIRDWINRTQAIAYVVVQRRFDDRQCEFPAPLGRGQSNTLTLTAATHDGHISANFTCERIASLPACRLQLSDPIASKSPYVGCNLFYYEAEDTGPVEDPFTADLLCAC